MIMVALPLLLAAAAAALAAPQSGHQLSSREYGKPAKYWYEEIRHNGISPFIPDGKDWTVYRNVKTHFGAKGDGITDDSAAIQAALDYGNSTDDRSSGAFATTGGPAVVYIPGGTYKLGSTINSYIDTIIMGDPLDMPILQAAPNFTQKFLWNGFDDNQGSTTNFYIGLKNLILDSTLLPQKHNITLLDWAVSQAVQLTNVVFNMAEGGVGHTGLSMPEGGSPLIMNDLVFQGGSVGIRMNEQQYHFKGLTFKSAHHSRSSTTKRKVLTWSCRHGHWA